MNGLTQCLLDLFDARVKPDAERRHCYRVSAIAPGDLYWGLRLYARAPITTAEREHATETIRESICGLEDGIRRGPDDVQIDWEDAGPLDDAPARRGPRAGLPKPPAARPGAPAPAGADDDAEPEPAADTREQRRHWGGSFAALAEGPSPQQLWPAESAPILIAQKEESSAGWQHWQFCVSFAKARRFAEVKRDINDAMGNAGIPLDRRAIWLCSFSEAKDAPLRNNKTALAKYRNYCRKSVDPKGGKIFAETREVRGLEHAGADGISRKGKRNDLTEYIAFAKAKRGLVDILDAEMDEAKLMVKAKYSRFAAEVDFRMVAGRPKQLKTALCFWGNTSTGKSTRAFKLAYAAYKVEEVYSKPPSDIWWDGYSPAVHKCIIVDEFGKAGTDPRIHSMLLQLLDKDRPVLQVQIKGVTTFVDPEMVIFTSIMHPFSWLQGLNANDHGGQYERRFNRILECKRVYQKDAEHQVVPEHSAALQAVLEHMPLDE